MQYLTHIKKTFFVAILFGNKRTFRGIETDILVTLFFTSGTYIKTYFFNSVTFFNNMFESGSFRRRNLFRLFFFFTVAFQIKIAFEGMKETRTERNRIFYSEPLVVQSLMKERRPIAEVDSRRRIDGRNGSRLSNSPTVSPRIKLLRGKRLV